ncbi:hypothetical protein [Nocardia sp. alder85J]|uniref:hypothetical protein n=1 Tax=Nocardia sp. alder85J TaxID=2862949 RepID=UPI001CD4A8B0|nr:hypothetical protein [Nocardia sp. alder85J]MCX4093021.1 hypothetical protein [Nocardia sp. alder85J]
MALVEPVLGPRPNGHPGQMRQLAAAHAATAGVRPDPSPADIAGYWHLPEDAQRNCQISVEVALEIAARMRMDGIALADNTQAREVISDYVHQAWMRRKISDTRPGRAPLMEPYDDEPFHIEMTGAERDRARATEPFGTGLSDEEQEKDRVYARIAVDLVLGSSRRA